jgi:transmembrane sensor
MSAELHFATELDPIRHQAVAWVQRMRSGEATADDAKALTEWCAQSPGHVAALAEAKRMWSDIGAAGKILRAHSHGVATSLDRLNERRRVVGRRAFLGGGLAAAASYAVVHPPFHLWPSFSELSADYRTATGEQRRIELAADVSVQLNTQSSLAIEPADANADRVQLISGEASFVTSTQAERSLIVLAADGTTIGSRARFDVRHMNVAGKASVCVTCLEGHVLVEKGADSATLLSGHQLRYDAAGLSFAAPIDAEVVSAWQRGIIVFRSVPLAEVVEEINRYRPGRIVLVNRELGTKPVNGRFRVDQMNEILIRLEQAFNARVRTLPGGIVLLG